MTGENQRFIQVEGTVVRLVGQLAVAELKPVEKAMREVVKQKPETLTLDLVHVDYMSSSYLGLIVGTASELEKAGGHVHVKAQGQVLRLLQLAGVDKVVTIEECKTWGPPPAP